MKKRNLSFRYIHDEWNETAPIPQYGFLQNSFPTIENQFYGPGTAMAARFTRTLSSTLLNEFVASYTNSHLTLADKPGIGVSLQRPSDLDAPCASVPNGPRLGHAYPSMSHINNLREWRYGYGWRSKNAWNLYRRK